MESERKNLLAVALVVAVAVCLVGVIAFVRRGPPTKEPTSVSGTRMELIDRETLEPVTLTRSEAARLACQGGYLRNPRTGKFSLTTPMTCPSCGATVGRPIPPPELADPAPDPNAPPAAFVSPGKIATWQAEQKCPKCGGALFAAPRPNR